MAGRRSTLVTRLKEGVGLRVGDVELQFAPKSAGQLHVTVIAPANVPIVKLPSKNIHVAQNKQDMVGKR